MDSCEDTCGFHRWVSPFRNLRIKACLRLPEAYRSLPRLSSALSAKVSALRPSLLNLLYSPHRLSPALAAFSFSISIALLIKTNQIFLSGVLKWITPFEDLSLLWLNNKSKICCFDVCLFCIRFSRYGNCSLEQVLQTSFQKSSETKTSQFRSLITFESE